MAAKRISIRLTPFQARKLEELRVEGLDPGAEPRTTTEVLVDALMYLHKRRIATATGRLEVVVPPEVITPEKKFQDLEIVGEQEVPDDEPEPYNATATPEQVAHVNAMLNNAVISQIPEPGLEDTDDANGG